MKKYVFKWIVTLLVIALTAACTKESTEPTPTTGSISGKVTFEGNWPATGNVQVSVYSSLTPPYAPTGAPEQSTDPVPSGSNEYDFVFEGLDFNSYAAVYVSWRNPANPDGARILGMYWANPAASGIDTTSGSPTHGLPVMPPTAVTIDADNPDLTGIDIKAILD